MKWRVKARCAGRIVEYVSDDGAWTLWSQPFTPVWHARHDGKFIKDFTKVSDARNWVATDGERFVAQYAKEIAAAPVCVGWSP